jgi:AcrR family transcriptional regulator
VVAPPRSPQPGQCGPPVGERPSARPQLGREVIAAFRRRHLEDTLTELCAEQGYRATTITDVTRRAHVARNTVYEHFANKEAIFLALLERRFAELFERVETTCSASDDDPRPRVEAGLGAVLGWVAAEPVAARACLVEAACATPRALQVYLGATARFTDLLRGCAPVSPTRPDSVEDLLVGGIASTLRYLVLAGEAERAPSLLPGLGEFLWQPYLVEGEDPTGGEW